MTEDRGSEEDGTMTLREEHRRRQAVSDVSHVLSSVHSRPVASMNK